MATRQVSRTDVVSLTALSFIRPQQLAFNVTDCKPNTRMYPFFDGVDVSGYITPSGGVLGGNLVASASGVVSGTFNLPASTFNTGTRKFVVQDIPAIDPIAVEGSSIGYAEATFTASGMARTLQETINTITTVVSQRFIATLPISRGGGGGGGGGHDPLAQSFFTYGISGGCFITAIDLYFQSKDVALPVILEIREMVNGYPGPTALATVSKPPSEINTSSTSALATKFTFRNPVYIEQDKEFCFVILANCATYNVWTSEMAKKSIETGKTIFEQPYTGSLFKSQNNTTWTAEQTEDIKFTMYKAAFDVTSRDIVFKTHSPVIGYVGSQFAVTSGSPVVTATFNSQHGYKTGDKIILSGQTSANYRGIPVATISSPTGFSVTVSSDYALTFSVGTNATSTGKLDTTGRVEGLTIVAGGSGYVAPTIAFSGGGGTGAAATLVVTSGVITGYTMTNNGTGYTSLPIATITPTGGGAGAVIKATSDVAFGISANLQFQSAAPLVSNLKPVGTNIVNSIRTTSVDRVAGTHTIFPLNIMTDTNKLSAMLNTDTETAVGITNSTEMILRMSTDNPNVSPVISLSERPRLRLNNYIVNDKSNAASELTTSGTAQARYLSKPVKLETVSKGARVFVNGASTKDTSFDVFIRTSLNNPTHKTLPWVAMSCDTDRNASATITEYKDYTFYLDGMSPFDTYDIKIVLYSSAKYVYPHIANYRAIILAT